MNIAVIGLGNIGFRHFQSILTLRKNHELFLVDNSSDALDKCKKYYFETFNEKQCIFFYNNIQKIVTKIDILVIATSSYPRRSIIEEVFKYQKPKYMILEKFLFPFIEDFQICEQLFKFNSTKVWVNQWMSQEFIEINQYFPNNKNMSFSVNGKNWGLCSNSVHFIDWFHKMTGRERLEIYNKNLSNQLSESRRKDYHELMGNLEIKSLSGHTLKLKCEKKLDLEEIDKRSIFIDISNIDYDFVAEFDGKSLNYEVTNKNTNSSIKKEIIVKPQSKKTSEIIKCLVESDTCNLVDYRISMEQHLLIFNIFKETFAANGYNTNNGIPVT